MVRWAREHKQQKPAPMDTKSDSASSSSSNAAGAATAAAAAAAATAPPASDVKDSPPPAGEVQADQPVSSSSAESKRKRAGEEASDQPAQKKAKPNPTPDFLPRTQSALAQMLKKHRQERSKADEGDEFKRWREMPPIEDVQADPCDWFRVHHAEWPIISLMAEKFLAVPASSAPCERLFSDAGNLFTTKRARITDEHAEQQLFLHENWTLLQQFITSHKKGHELEMDTKADAAASTKGKL